MLEHSSERDALSKPWMTEKSSFKASTRIRRRTSISLSLTMCIQQYNSFSLSITMVQPKNQ